MAKNSRAIIKELPADVRMVLGYLRCQSLDEEKAYLGRLGTTRMLVTRPENKAWECELMLTLTADTDHVTMWRAIARRSSDSDVLWVYAFLGAVQSARQLPSYFYLASADRKDLVKRIKNAVNELKRIHKANDLEFNLVHLDGKIFNGFYALEDFSDKNQESIEKDGLDLLPVGDFLERIAERAEERLDEVPGGKAAKTVRAIRFARQLAERNKRLYGQHLGAVIATATNSLFRTGYSVGDIAKLLSRAPKG